MPNQAPQAVFAVHEIGIDRFDIGRPDRNRVKVPHRQARKNISLKLKIRLQMFLGQ